MDKDTISWGLFEQSGTFKNEFRLSAVISGDCREVIKRRDFLELIKGREAVIVTDPPFNIGYHYGTYNDRMKHAEYMSMLKETISGLGFPFVLIHYPEEVIALAVEIGRVPTRVVSWVYNSNTARQHRDIAFFGIKPDFSLMTQPYKNPTDKRIAQRIAEGKGARLYDWWEVNQVKNVQKAKDGISHPCVMPLEVMKRVVGILPRNVLVIDPFCGSGTTGVACGYYDIDFVGIEIDQKYAEEARARIAGAGAII